MSYSPWCQFILCKPSRSLFSLQTVAFLFLHLLQEPVQHTISHQNFFPVGISAKNHVVRTLWPRLCWKRSEMLWFCFNCSAEMQMIIKYSPLSTVPMCMEETSWRWKQIFTVVLSRREGASARQRRDTFPHSQLETRAVFFVTNCKLGVPLLGYQEKYKIFLLQCLHQLNINIHFANCVFIVISVCAWRAAGGVYRSSPYSFSLAVMNHDKCWALSLDKIL